jgi:hypothetical protein
MSMTGLRPLPVVPRGPLAFRYRIRRLGPVVALVPAAVLGVASSRLLQGNTTTQGVLGFATAVLAAPALMPFGVPFSEGSGPIVIGALVSAALWLVIGFVAARRATRSPVATWRDFWREYLFLAAGAWLGAILSLGVIQLLLGRVVL